MSIEFGRLPSPRERLRKCMPGWYIQCNRKGWVVGVRRPVEMSGDWHPRRGQRRIDQLLTVARWLRDAHRYLTERNVKTTKDNLYN